ncbi:MAG: T9SS type A sorting domain-containing protein [Flavobacteriaceae bacterium]|nr:T9SS type A sorting domain-containing protein [Flavobacteriaceae bacterium]
MKNLIYRTILVFFSLFMITINAQQNFPHIKTFGFDYIRFQDSNGAFLDNLRWLANHHDWIVGPKGNWSAQGVDYLDTLTYNTIKDENPNVKIMMYLPHHSMAPTTQTWLENWATDNGYDPENLYYHYYYDTTINLANGSTLTIPGYGGGTATSLEEARLRVRWNGGWVGVNPSSQTFREAYRALALHVITLEGTTDTFADGLFLDTFDGLMNQSVYTSYLENTIELKDIGTTDEIYSQVAADLANSADELKTFLIQNTGNSSFRVQANPAVPRYIYNTFSELFNEQYRELLMDLTIEYLVTTTTRLSDLPYLQLIYDDMDNGRLFFIRSQTNFGPPTEIPFRFIQFTLANHYLINHENVHFMYHYGSAANYGGYPYGNPQPTHWHQNMEINIGQPITRSQEDYWGEINTDRFFIFAQGSDYTIIGREYDDALVLAKFSQVGGWANIGNNQTTHNLDGVYYPLLENNTTDESSVTSISLGTNEGIILLKSPIETLSINEVTENEINIYPNPVKDILTINNREQFIESYKIYNTIGQVVQSDSSFNENKINISQLKSGVYFLKILSNQKETTVKFIKNKYF